MIDQVVAYLRCDCCGSYARPIVLEENDPYTNSYSVDFAIDEIVRRDNWINDPDLGFLCTPACQDITRAKHAEERARLIAAGVIKVGK